MTTPRQSIEERIEKRYPAWKRKLPYGKVGVGYIVNPEDPYEIIPDQEQITLLEEAFDFVDAGNSLREVCEWLSQKLSRSLVHQTISNLYNKHRRPFLNRKTNKRQGRVRTKEEMKVAAAKANIRKAMTKAQKLETNWKEKKLQAEDFIVPPEVKKRPNNFAAEPKDTSPPPVPKESSINFVFQPNAGPQSEFLSATEQEVLYGGGAGGGKTYAMIADPMRYFDNPNFVGLLLRRTNDELREIIWETNKLYPKIWPKAKWSDQKSMWTFPSGAKFWITYLDRDQDVMRYQGQAFTWIGMDELTQYPTPFAYTYLKSRLRSADPELQRSLCMRATTNPGGPGHQWVKKMFIDPAPAGQSFWARDLETDQILRYPVDHEDPNKRNKPLFKRRFIPALVKDNPYLYADGSYERSLLGLPEAQKRKLLEGDWSIVEGAAFAEFSPRKHVCDPFPIPNDWRRFRAADYGYSSPACVLWFAIDPAFETLYVYRELYQAGMTAVDMASKVLEMERDDRVSYGILDSSVWHDRGHFGPSIAEEMIGYGCRWRPSDRSKGSRVAGKNRLHELLKTQVDGLGNERTGIKFFNTCRQIITDLPSIPSDPDGSDDIDDRYPNDHSYDALRYGIMSRPRSGSALDWGSTPRDIYSPSDSTFGY